MLRHAKEAESTILFHRAELIDLLMVTNRPCFIAFFKSGLSPECTEHKDFRPVIMRNIVEG